MTAPLDDELRPQLRGYRREQVDEVIRVLEGRVAAHDRAIAHLRGAAQVSTLGDPVVAPESPETSVPATALTADDDSQPVASRAGRAGRAARTKRDRATPEPPPVPWRRSDLAAPAVYLLLAVWLLSGLVADLRSGYLSQGVQDQQAFEWYFGATAHNLVTFSNPLFTDLQNYPDGVNLMANASVLGLGIPLAPLTLLAGPSATFVLVEVLGLALTASAWFWLFRRRLAVHPLLAAIGAGFVGFAPGMISHANGHPNFVAQFLVPLIVDRVIRLAQGGRPRRDAVVLGLLAAWQVFIGEEVLLLTAIGLAIAAPVMLAHHREVLRPLARGLALGAAVCLAIVAVPLWWQFAGPRSYTSIWHPPGGNDLAQLWGRATRTVGADVWASAALSMNRTEENSFFGIPLLLAAVAVVIALWRRPVVQALGVVVVLSCWFSLGEEVVVNGRPTGIPAPGLLFEHVPILENVLPTRFALIAVPALGALLAIGAEEVRRAVGRSSASPGAALAAAAGAAGIILLPVLPTPLVVDQRAPMPQFFVDGSWKDWVDEGGSVLAAPAPWVGDTRALEWQAQARWGFPVVAGYFVGPDTTPERGGQYGATPTGLTQWMAAITEADQPSLATPEQVEEFTTNLRQGRVDAIVLPQGRPAEGALLASLTSAFGEPVTTGGVHVWDVRSVTDGAG